jgi:hypothetical protein
MSILAYCKPETELKTNTLAITEARSRTVALGLREQLAQDCFISVKLIHAFNWPY